MYFQETRQKLDVKVASHIANDNQFFTGDSVNINVLKNVFHNVMIINPSIEVYLLNTNGKILAYDAPPNTVKLTEVPLKPIIKFIKSESKEHFFMGVDPKSPGKEKAFSAAKVLENGKLKGYIYVILGGQEYENASQLLFGSYILRLGVRSMIIALITAALIGFLAIGIIIRNLRKIIYVIREFRDGNLKARIHVKSKGELNEFANSFNEMADTIVVNLDKIKRMDNQRRDLIANVSHDLRTPLSIVRGYIETILIKDERLNDEDRKKYLETSLKSTERLLSLVEELFELSKLDAEELKPKPEKFSLAEILQDIHQKNYLTAKKRNINLELNIQDNIPLINADIGMMEKVFQNLLDNAFKFTSSGGKIKMNLKLESSKTILAEISDTGIGISEDDLPLIFDRFNHTKRITVENDHGTGLGLTIVKRILDMHGVSINVESKINKGTNFYLRFQVV